LANKVGQLNNKTPKSDQVQNLWSKKIKRKD
jgi:hypothetical protein